MDIQTLTQWLDVIFKIMIAAFSIWLYFDRRNDKTDDKLVKIELRLIKLEVEKEQQITHDHLAEIYKELRAITELLSTMNCDVTGKISDMGARINLAEKQVERMDSFWRNHNP